MPLKEDSQKNKLKKDFSKFLSDTKTVSLI